MRDIHLHLYSRETKRYYKGKNGIVNSGGVINSFMTEAVII